MTERITHYYCCDYCEKNFDTKERCLTHENKHFLPLGILDQDFVTYYESGGSSKYPSVITIKFEDKYIRYQMQNIYSDQEKFED